jgi:hypothetical protein
MENGDWKTDSKITLPKILPNQKLTSTTLSPHFLVIPSKFCYIFRSPNPLIGNQVKHLLILFSILLLSSPVIGQSEETCYVVVDSSEEFNPTLLSNISVSLIHSF